MPESPQLVAEDTTYPSGFVRLFAGSGSNKDNTGTFRFVHVADAHIPEPELADANLDGEVNGLDVDPFVDVR